MNPQLQSNESIHEHKLVDHQNDESPTIGQQIAHIVNLALTCGPPSCRPASMVGYTIAVPGLFPTRDVLLFHCLLVHFSRALGNFSGTNRILRCSSFR